MTHSHYGLQALLYTVALHRYLRWRLPADRVADWRVQRIGRVLRSDDDRGVVLPPRLQAILEGVVELLDLECVPRLVQNE